ncbi:Major facilitator superfamily domain general substrate transporter [Penicillium expansum]|nr:Major facilitator superfamily domain general substrate transporter [Penicillium expansum]
MDRRAESKQLAEQSEVIRLIKADTVPWYKKPNLRFLYLCLIPAALGVEMTTGYDGSVLNGLQAVATWQTYFNSPKGALLGVVNASYNLGGLITLPIVPYVNDKFGRKHSITFGSTILIIGVALQSASQNIGMFLASRLILGAGIPFAVSGASQLLAELTYPRERAVITGLFNTSWFIGSIMAASVTLGTHTMGNDWGWRIPSILQAAPAALQLIFIWFVPESPRWLLSKDRSEEAFDILVKYHGEGDRNSALVNAEFIEISAQLKLEIENSKSRWVELVQSPGNRKRTLIAICVGIFTQWSGNGLVSYYLAKVLATVGVTDKKTQNVINLSLSCWMWICATGSAFLTSFLPRRIQYLTAFVGMTIVFSVWTGVSAGYAQHGTHSEAIAVVAMIFLYNAMYSVMQPLTYTYVTEIFPFVHRAKGIAILQIFTRGSTAFNSFVNPIGMDDLGWKFYLVYVVWLVVETTIIFFLYPETKGPTLEEISQIFDGPKQGGDEKLGDDEKQEVSHIDIKAEIKAR